MEGKTGGQVVLSHSIYIAALIPTLVVLIFVLGLLLWRSPPAERRLIALLFALELPMFFVSTFLIRQPFNHWFNTVVPAGTTMGMFLRMFQAPLVEESCKLWLIFLVFSKHRLNAGNAVRIGMAVGAGFGVSEIWGLAYLFSHAPGAAGQPWYYFMGFVQERILVAPLHGVFVVAAARQIVKGGRWIVIGVLSGMGLHYLANFPILLAKLDAFHLGTATWATVLNLYVALYAFSLYLLLLYFSYGAAAKRKALPPPQSSSEAEQR
jgi:hypothetical protein